MTSCKVRPLRKGFSCDFWEIRDSNPGKWWMILKTRGHLWLVLDYHAINRHSCSMCLWAVGQVVQFAVLFLFLSVKNESESLLLLLCVCSEDHRTCALLCSCSLADLASGTPGCLHIEIIISSSCHVQLRGLSLAIIFGVMCEDAKTPRLCRVNSLFYCK